MTKSMVPMLKLKLKLKLKEKKAFMTYGFEVGFFSEKETLDLVERESFKMLRMRENYEEPVTLYLAAPIRLEKNQHM